MSMLRIHSDGAGLIDEQLQLFVWKTPDHSGNLCNGQYRFSYSHTTVNLRPHTSLNIGLVDCTGLDLKVVNLLSTVPKGLTIAPLSSPPDAYKLHVGEELQSGQLVFFSIVLASTNLPVPVVLYCDPQVGNDPKVSPI